MFIEVTGTSTRNKGAELMMVAIREHFKECHYCNGIGLVVGSGFGSYEDRARHALWYKPEIKKWGRSRIALKLLPESFTHHLGMVADENIVAMIDASGFAFGDQHPMRRSEQFAKKVERAKKAGKKIVLLPQAFGPFKNPPMRSLFARIVAMSDLVFARDNISFEYAKHATKNDQRIYLAPDFTNLVKPPALIHSTDQSKQVLIIPNQRIVEFASAEEGLDSYIALLLKFIKLVAKKGLKPAILVHGIDDRQLAEILLKRHKGNLPIIEESDPVLIKKRIAESHLVIASRYHALVSALSQGVPAIGTSWSHKYEELFKDYSCQDLLLGVYSDDSACQRALEKTIMPERKVTQKILTEKGKSLVGKAKEMWRKVDHCIGITQDLT